MSTAATVPSASNANFWLCDEARIEEIVPELTGVATYRLRFVDDTRQLSYAFRPGQFNMLYLPGVGECAISLSAGVGCGSVSSWDHTIRFAGNVTRAISRLKIGHRLGVRGPFGAAWPVEDCDGADVLLVAGGIGLAPLRPVIYELMNRRSRFGRVTLLYGARSPDVLLYERDFADWQAAGIAVQVTVDRASTAWHDNIGVVPLLIDRLRPMNASKTVLMACGPEVMMRYCVRSALARGLRPEQVWLSLERNMQCAVGFCGHCQLGPAFVCRDGPVFRYDRIGRFLCVEAL